MGGSLTGQVRGADHSAGVTGWGWTPEAVA
jgi:hypothetical protein